MMSKNCYNCGKENLSKDEIGITKKFLGSKAIYFFCLKCLAEQLEVDEDYLLEKIEEYKSAGCSAF